MTAATVDAGGVRARSAEILHRASALGEAGRHRQALALLDRQLQRTPDDADLHTARGWALENLGPPALPDACAAYETAIALDAGQCWARVGLATVLGPLGRPERCAPLYRDAIERALPRAAQEPEYLELIGWCRFRLGELDRAVDAFRDALAVDAGWVSVHFDLGLVLLLQGEADAAAGHYRQGLEALGRRAPAARLGALQVALDDLDEVLAARAATAAASVDSADPGTAAGLRATLTRALAAAGDPRDE